MAINISQAFKRTSANPVDESLTLTKAQMVSTNDNLMPSKYFTICQEDGYIYLYDKSNEADQTTGKFRKFEGGSGGASELVDLEDVLLTSLANGQTLAWDSTSEKWVNANMPTVPTKTSDLTNDSGFITKVVNDLVNYYLKSETYSKTEVDTIVAAIKNSRFELVNTLPTTDIQTNVIYLVPSSDPQTSNVKDEYINLDGTTAGWELIGSTAIDLSGYVTTSNLNTALAAYTTTTDLTTLLAAKQDTLTEGDGIDITGSTISIDPMPSEDMDDVIDELPTGNRFAVTGYVPLATIISVYSETAPKFFLACDGSTYNKADYPELANHLLSLTTHSQYEVDGDDTKFKVPDLRGEFLRGTGSNSHVNNGDGANVGVHQDATTHNLINPASDTSIITYHKEGGENGIDGQNSDKRVCVENTAISAAGSYTLKGVTVTGAKSSTGLTANQYTSRPTNTSVLYCIAYKDIYSNPMNDYSETEKVVGTWVNGATIYQKTIDLGSLPNATYKDVSHNIANFGRLIALSGSGSTSDGNSQFALPYSTSNVSTLCAVFLYQKDYIRIVDNTDLSSFSAYVTIQYTKTT